MAPRALVLAFLLAFAARGAAQDCTGWVQQFPSSHAIKAFRPNMVYDQKRSVTVLFMVTVVPDTHCETWEWNGMAWTFITEDGPCVSSGAMAYDSKRGVTVLFGGNSQAGISNATWEWDGATWVEREPQQFPPPPRYGHAMAYDSNRGVTVLFGGGDDEEGFTDTWEYNGESWTERFVDGPQARAEHAMSFDPVRGFVVMFGTDSQQTWEWDGEQWFWRGDLDGSRRGAAMDFDSDRGQVVRFGGEGGGGIFNDTQAWDGQNWKIIPSDVKPEARTQAGMAYDTARGTMVLFGGERLGGFILEDTWEFVCEPPCYADLDGSGSLDLFDFFAFVNLFNTLDPKADCDTSGSLDLFDFLCFLNEFNTGCP